VPDEKNNQHNSGASTENETNNIKTQSQVRQEKQISSQPEFKITFGLNSA
jgi:hypothetical protein